MSARIGEYLQTFSGAKFWPLDPRPEEVHLEDLAASLAKLCRFGGHTVTPLPETLEPWGPERAEREFLARFGEVVK